MLQAAIQLGPYQTYDAVSWQSKQGGEVNSTNGGTLSAAGFQLVDGQERMIVVEGLADKAMKVMAQLATKLLQDKASRAEAAQSVAERYGQRQVLLNQAARSVQDCVGPLKSLCLSLPCRAVHSAMQAEAGTVSLIPWTHVMS